MLSIVQDERCRLILNVDSLNVQVTQYGSPCLRFSSQFNKKSIKLSLVIKVGTQLKYILYAIIHLCM